MAKYLVFNIPQHGNVNPTLAIVQELVKRGEEVIYYLPDDFRQAVEGTGAQFRCYSSQMANMGAAIGTPKQMNADTMSRFAPHLIEECRQLIPLVLADLRGERPTAILYGPIAIWGRMLAQILQVPAVLMRPSYASNEHFHVFRSATFMQPPNAELVKVREAFRADFALLCEQYAIEPFELYSVLTHVEPLTLVFLPRAFQIASETFDERFKFVGPCILPRHDTTTNFPLELLGKQPTLYISLGTSFNQRHDFYNLCFKAFGDSAWQVVQSIGKRVKLSELDPVPDNFIVDAYVPQLEVLEHTSVFVTHGGMNSTMEALANGLPLVVVPQMVEQAVTAQRVAELGIGIALDPDTLTQEVLRDAVEQVNSDPAFREQARQMQRIIQQSDGYRAAADEISKYIYGSREGYDNYEQQYRAS